MKKVLIAVLVLVIIGAAAGALVLYILQPVATGLGATGEGQTTRLERWLGDRLRSIADANLNPDFTFTELDYEYPATVTLSDVLLVDDDINLVSAAGVTIEFTEIPKVGRSIVIERISLDRPSFHFVPDVDGGWRGWSNLIAREDAAEDEKARQPRASTRPSDVFAIRRIDVTSAAVRYEPPDEPPMRLDGLTFDLTTNPVDDEPGWYNLDVELDRDMLFALSLDGRLNIDDAVLDLAALSLLADLEPDRYEFLPPRVQQYVVEHAITGRLEADVAGTIPLRDPVQSRATLNAELIDGFIAFGTYTVPVRSMDTTLDISEGVVTIDSLILSALGGQATVRGDAHLTGEHDAFFNFDAEDLRLGELIQPSPAAARAEAPDETGDVVPNTTTGQPAQPKYSGVIDYVGTVSLALDQVPESLDGEGTLNVTEGKLVFVPVIGGLVRTVAGAINPSGGNMDTLDSKILLNGREVQFREVKMISQTVAARGAGEVGFDGSLNFRFNAGPLERAQESLGAIGEVLGRITDRLVTYQVTGTVGEPKFSTKALGLGVEKPADDAGAAGNTSD